jgi:hypothetical protein
MAYTKYKKTQRLRSRLTFQYNKGDYRSAARLGEALLRAHVREKSINSHTFARDLYNVSLAQKAAGRFVRAAELRTEAGKRAIFLRDNLLTSLINKSKRSKRAKIRLGIFYYLANILPEP